MNIDKPARGLMVPWKNRQKQIPADSEGLKSRRFRGFDFLPKKVKGHLVAVAGEFVGTFLFLLFAFGGTNVVNTAPAVGVNATANLASNPAKLLYISLSFGMALAVNAWVFFRISGGLFNPAVTLGMMIIGSTGYIRGPLIIVAQILGAICAAAVIQALLPGPLAVSTSLGGGTSIVQGLFIEMFLTAELVFTIFMLVAEKNEGTFIAPVGIGLSLFIAELMGVYYTGGSLNPARSFGPAVVIRSFHGYHWIYWLGPCLGAILASAFFLFMKALEYETVNKESPGESGATRKPEIEKRQQSLSHGIDGRQGENGTYANAAQQDLYEGLPYNNNTGHISGGNSTSLPVGGVNNRGLVHDHITHDRNLQNHAGSNDGFTSGRSEGNYREAYSTAPTMENDRTAFSR